MNTTQQTPRLDKLVFQAVLMRVIPTLSEEKITEYEKIVSGENAGEVLFKFLKIKVPNFENIVKEEEEILKKELDKEAEKQNK